MAKNSKDSNSFDELKTRVERIVEARSAGDSWLDLYERVLSCAPSGSSTDPSTNEGVTAEPNARQLYDSTLFDSASRIVQMYSVNPPTVEIPIRRSATAQVDETDPIVAAEYKERQDAAARVSEFLHALMDANDKFTERSLVADTLWAAMYGQVPIIIAPRDDDSATDVPPFILTAEHPRQSYPVRSPRRGLVEHVIRIATTVGAVRSDYGDAASFLEGNDTDEVTIVDYMSRSERWVWVEEQNEQPLLHAEIPPVFGGLARVCQRTPLGPGFWTGTDLEFMSYGRPYIKSGVYGLMNTLYTVMATLALNYANVMLIKKMQPGRESEGEDPDWSKHNQVLHGYQVGEGFEPVVARTIPTELLTLHQIAAFRRSEQLVPAIFSGTAPGGIFAASGLNLLATLAKMSTLALRLSVEDALSKALTIVLRWAKAREGEGGVLSVLGRGGLMELSAADLEPLGDDLNVLVRLNPDQAMERMANVNIAGALRAMGLGYPEFLRVLVQAGLATSEADAMQHIYERAAIEAELPRLAKEHAELAKQLFGVTQSIPQAVPPAGMVPPNVPPAGMVPPDIQQGVMPGAVLPSAPPVETAAMKQTAVEPQNPPPELSPRSRLVIPG